MTEYAGACLCGAVTFVVQGRFDHFYLCHCRHCQKDTGSAHAANLFSRSARVVWHSGADAITAFTLPGTRHGKCFCQRCGSALPDDRVEGMLVVPAGCLDTEFAMVPDAHLFTASRAGWDDALEAVPEFGGLPE
ncbi:GFA family protein [Marinobacterium weihaiense]|uniref:GFA family protein n=1 Tax=Marinobacterium weihaiense TaxID=2851016 RepID=A0ABS6MEN8_9GAMM|nr:GFA family protein [Marinobacterium weihaiense]MBV0934286.1 GFA family protein [Marinobacterium weihaiense]